MTKNRNETIAALLLFFVLVIGGALFFESSMLYLRLLIGMGLGYSLMRAYTGFAGSVNRAYRTGSTKLMQAMMLMFFVTAVGMFGLLAFKPESVEYGLWVNPINLGLLLGGLLFGFGMSLSICCASGVLTDLVTSLPRAGVTLVFFMLGVFLGFPIQKTSDMVQKSWFSTASYPGGVYLPDLLGGPFGGHLFALVVTGLLCLLVVYFARRYEAKRRLQNTYYGNPMEIFSEKANSYETKESRQYSSLFDRLFVRPWTLTQGALALAVIFLFMTAATGRGWGASTPYGIWVGQLLHSLGVSPEALANFTHFPVDKLPFVKPFLSHPVTIQNFGIVFGTLTYMLLTGTFRSSFLSDLHLTAKEAAIYALGGFLMGFGTRLANGCNVGALYTPIANFSLSGWIFFVVMVIGAILGNRVFFGKAGQK